MIDARITSGKSGGVETVISGIADGLSGLEGPETYSFVCWPGHVDWLEPHVNRRMRIQIYDDSAAKDRGLLRRSRRRLTALPRSILRRRAIEAPQFHSYIDALRPDVVHLPQQFGFLTTKPSIYHPHDLQHVHMPEYFTLEERERRETWYGMLCRRAAMVAVATEWTRMDVISHFRLDPERVQVVPLAPPIVVARPPTSAQCQEVARRLALPEHYILYPAQTWPHKNHLALMKALALAKRRDGMTIPLVATGFQTDVFEELVTAAEALGIARDITWTGFVAPEDLRAVYLGARAVVIPTLFEAASGPLWEAFAFGVPAACSNVTSLPDQAGDAAIVFDPLDIAEITDAVVRLWTDEILRAELIIAGRERVKALSWDKTARTFRAHYRRLAKRPLDAEDIVLLRDASSRRRP